MSNKSLNIMSHQIQTLPRFASCVISDAADKESLVSDLGEVLLRTGTGKTNEGIDRLSKR